MRVACNIRRRCATRSEDPSLKMRCRLEKNPKRKERPMKVRNSLRSLKNKPGAQVVRRRGKVYVLNKKEPRFKARQG